MVSKFSRVPSCILSEANRNFFLALTFNVKSLKPFQSLILENVSPKFDKNQFTKILSGRKILSFPHYVIVILIQSGTKTHIKEGLSGIFLGFDVKITTHSSEDWRHSFSSGTPCKSCRRGMMAPSFVFLSFLLLLVVLGLAAAYLLQNFMDNTVVKPQKMDEICRSNSVRTITLGCTKR